MEEIYINKNTKKTFDDAVVSVLRSVEKQGWSLFQVYDLKERLSAKGFDQDKLKIIEICSAKHANHLLAMNRLVSLCMPCKINVIEDDGNIMIAAMKPTMISELFLGIDKESIINIEEDIQEIIRMSL
jgi:uncharacterized protein (DUF302 family)